MTDIPSLIPELLILRHGETEWNRIGRLQGGLDSPLTERGREQARHQGAILRAQPGIERFAWRSSPQGRAMQTAELARGEGQGALIPDDRLREIGMGDWAGARRDDLEAQHPELFQGAFLAWYDHAPGGEGLRGLADRVAGFLADLSAPTVIVTHGITSRVMRCLATGRPHTDLGLVEGGQGVVYRIRGGVSEKLT